MSEYKAIHGVKIRDYTTDPDNLIDGQVWFDKTNKVLQFQENNPAGSFATGGDLNNATANSAGWGTQTSAVKALGGTTDNPAPGLETELYNGSAWTEVNDANLARFSLGGTGVNTTSGLVWGGYGTPGASPVRAETEVWNGTNWTEVNDLNTVRNEPGCAGVTTAALTFGGAGTTNGYTESWNGTNWTELADINTARNSGSGFGVTNTAAVYCAEGSGVNGLTELWNGTAWTEVNDLNTARRQMVQGAAGSSTSGLVFGGETPGAANVALVETFNGTSWSAFANLSVARRGGIGAGASTASGLFSGGNPDTDATEEYTAPKIAVKTVDID